MSLQLEPYQEEGVAFLLEGNRLLSDEMGLGKTAQSLVAAGRVLGEMPDRYKVLVVTKKSLTTQWRREVEKWIPEYSVGVLTSSMSNVPKTKIIITNYEALYKHNLGKHHILIVDESHLVKNRKAKRTKAVRDLARKAEYVWLLTGTPTPNKVKDLWSQLNILSYPSYPSFWKWVDEYLNAFHNGFGFEVGGVRPRRVKDFREDIAEWVMGRSKQVLDLPPLSFEAQYVSMTPRQAKAYREMKELTVTMLENGEMMTAPNVLAQLTRLRQISTAPELIEAPGTSSKTKWMEEFQQTLKELGKKALVFSNFASYCKLLHNTLPDTVMMIGEMSGEARDKAVDQFQYDPDTTFLIGSIGAMGEGLNLTEAEIVIFTDPPWTPALVDQALSRAHRRGQENPVHVIHLLSEGSVDEYIYELLNTKDEQISEAMATRRVLENLMLAEKR